MKNILLFAGIVLSIASCSTVTSKSVAKELFSEIDLNKNKNISFSELRKHFIAVEGETHNAKEKAMSIDSYSQSRFKTIDTNHDNKIDYDEFYNIVK